MRKFTIKPDPGLDPHSEAFGAYIVGNEVFLPDEIVQVLKEAAIGEDAKTTGRFLSSFPVTVAATLNLSPKQVLQSAQDFLELLGKAGMDTSAAAHVSRGRGARHPGELGPSRIRSSN
jgi:hypothetical protein